MQVYKYTHNVFHGVWLHQYFKPQYGAYFSFKLVNIERMQSNQKVFPVGTISTVWAPPFEFSHRNWKFGIKYGDSKNGIKASRNTLICIAKCFSFVVELMALFKASANYKVSLNCTILSPNSGGK